MSDEVANTHHTHIYAFFCSSVRFSTLKNKFTEAHFEKAYGSSCENRDYIFKEGHKWSKISEKSMHKIRKTYISTLIDSQLVNLNTIRSLVGHEDERTTLKCYCFNRKNDLQTQESLEKALCL